MKTVFRLMVGASALALAACSSLPGASLGKTFSAEPYLAADHGGPGFSGALASEYAQLGRNQAKMVRWMNATAFISKAEEAEAGGEPAPWTPDQLGVNGEASALYTDVVARIGANKAERPAECARAQAMWDQYLTTLRAEAAGAKCPLGSEDALAMLNEALAACDPTLPGPGADFIVYFGFNRTNLTDRAREVVGEVVGAYNAMGSSAVSIVGHTDTVGSVSYNQGLSERRANRVANALVERGIPAGVIATAGRSELQPARETGDNVREPLNRRATISLSK
ncbi:MAG: OmpA family protein [Pseudomonadota bacterium]